MAVSVSHLLFWPVVLVEVNFAGGFGTSKIVGTAFQTNLFFSEEFMN